MSSAPSVRNTQPWDARDDDPTLVLDEAGSPGVRLFPSGTRGQRLGAAAILFALIVFIAAGFWPGHMSADTITQINEVKSGDLTNWHTPILLALWKPLFEIGVGPGYLLLGQLVVFTIGTFLVLRIVFRPLPAAWVTVLIAFVPPILGMLGYLGRDTWMVAFLVLTTGAVAWASQATGRRRTAWIVLAFVAAWLTLATRQNAAAAAAMPLIPLVALLGSQWRARRSDWPRWLATRARRVVAVLGLALALTLALMGTQYAFNWAIGTRDGDPEQTLFVHDLAHLSVRENENLLPPEVLKDRSMRTLRERYNVDSFTYTMGYTPGAPLRFPLNANADRALREAWRETILDKPFAYLDMRWDLWLRQITVTRQAIWAYHPQVDPNADGYVIRYPGFNSAVKDYIDGFADEVNDGRALFYTVWAYLLIGLVAGILLLRWGRSVATLAVAMLGFSALTYQTGIFFGAMVTVFRFEGPVVVMALLTLAVTIGLWRLRRRAPAAASAA